MDEEVDVGNKKAADDIVDKRPRRTTVEGMVIAMMIGFAVCGEKMLTKGLLTVVFCGVFPPVRCNAVRCEQVGKKAGKRR